MLNRLFILFILSVLTVSCVSTKRIPTHDKSSLSLTRKELFSKLDSSFASYNKPNNFYSRVATIDVTGLPVPALKSNIYIKTDEQLVAHLSIPFPPMQVGKVRLGMRNFQIRSGLAGIDTNVSFDSELLPYIQSVFLGQIPFICHFYGEKDFQNFDVYIQNNRIVLRRLGSSISTQIELDSQFKLSAMQIARKNDYINIECTDYKPIDNFLIPHTMQIIAAVGGNSYKATISHRNISLNQKKTLSFE